MAQTTSARRGVLSNLNVNATICSPSTRSKTGRAEEPTELGETFLQNKLEGDKMSDAVRKEAGVVGTKRRLVNQGSLGQEGDAYPYKKPKGDSALQFPERATERVSGDEQHLSYGGLSNERTSGSMASLPRPVGDSLSHTSSAPSSPASSGGFSETALNDTQFTEPEPELEESLRATLTHALLRQRAEAIRLRLRLASYKVRTNQIHVSMSQLQVRTIGSERLPAPCVKSQNRVLSPSITASNIPYIQLHKPSVEKGRETGTISASPTVVTNAASLSPNKSFTSPVKVGGETREEFGTPLLPRHRQAFLRPANVGSAIWDETSPAKELTSSVVKKSTADTLLSLKLQR